jgi:hypothetical protein|tara:strand:- start:464 stop:661 length:198 start_codon:yes stop_codon:yes gene_type:complete
MGSYEDIFYEVIEEVESLGLRKQFDKELKNLRDDDKFKYVEIRDRWWEAKNRVITEYRKNKNENI